jgi:PAS domain S-box-containing protein
MSDSKRIEELQKELDILRKRVRDLEVSEESWKKSEETLLQSERKYRTIFENTGAATILIDHDTTITMVNTEYEKLTAMAREDVEGKRSWTEFIYPDDLEAMVDYHYRRRNDPALAPRNYEARIINKHGEMHYCYLTVAVVPGTNQSVASLLDITERINAEDALRASEEQYRLLVETMNDGLGVQDENGLVTYVNDRMCQMVGYSREELIGRSVVELLVSDYRRIWLDQLLRRQDHYDPYEVAWRKKDGELFYSIVSPKPVYDARGKYAGTFAIFTDITERKKAEVAIHNSEEKFAKAFRSSPDAMTISTLKDGRFIDVNDTFLRITGRTREETIDHTAVELKVWPSEDYRRELIAKLQGQGNLQSEEVFFRTKSGETRIGIYSADSIELRGENCIISVFADVTEQKRLEKEILAISERERQQIGQDLHDDLQQHLIGIEALGKLLANRLNAQDMSEAAIARDIVALIREAITKTRTLARGLCPIYLDENTLAPAIREFAAHIQSIFSVACKVFMGKAVSIKDNTTAAHLYQIIQESVNNAIRHGRATAIEIRMVSRQNTLRLSIADNGTGIAENKGKKQGLGLNIMKHRARMIDGELTITKNSHGGTTVQCLVKQKY